MVRSGERGWCELSVPPEEAWERPVATLSASQRDRIRSVDFYELLRREVIQRFQKLQL